jgi:hypothetical protein
MVERNRSPGAQTERPDDGRAGAAFAETAAPHRPDETRKRELAGATALCTDNTFPA